MRAKTVKTGFVDKWIGRPSVNRAELPKRDSIRRVTRPYFGVGLIVDVPPARPNIGLLEELRAFDWLDMKVAAEEVAAGGMQIGCHLDELRRE